MLSACATSTTRSIKLEVRTFDYDIPPLLCDAPQWNNIETVATLLLPDLLRAFNRALFIDADTLVVGDISELWDTDLEGKPCACVPDFDSTSPNTGLILYDITEWNRRNLTPKCLEYVATHRTFHVDQEPFTAVSGAEFKVLDLKWNYHGVDTWMVKHFGRNLATNDLRVIHFNGPPRPWFRKCPRRYAALWSQTFVQTPLRTRPLPELTERDFLSFRMSRLEIAMGRAFVRFRPILIPYLLLRKARMLSYYYRYRLSLRTAAVDLV